jgi:hypothetical protein
MLKFVDWKGSAKDVATPELLGRVMEREKLKKFHGKADLDFSLALQECLDNSTSPYIALFEGDILLANGWFARTRMGIDQIRATGRPWLDLRLFNAENSIGWASRHLLGNGVLPVTGGIIVFLLLAQLITRQFFDRQLLSYPTLAVVCLLTVPGLVILFFQSGKSSMLPPRAGVTEQNWGCCSQGIVLPRAQVPGFIQTLRRISTDGPPDLVILAYAREMGLSRFALNPVQIQHLSMYPTKTSNPLSLILLTHVARSGISIRWRP